MKVEEMVKGKWYYYFYAKHLCGVFKYESDNGWGRNVPAGTGVQFEGSGHYHLGLTWAHHKYIRREASLKEVEKWKMKGIMSKL